MTQAAAAAVAGLAGVRVEQLDLTDPGSIEGFARRWLASDRPLHAVINNAGVVVIGLAWTCVPVKCPVTHSPVPGGAGSAAKRA